MNTDISTDISQRHDTISTVVLGVLVGLAVLAAVLDAAVTATDHPVLVGLGLAGVAVLVGLGRWVARRVRERREDAADAVAGAAWRTEHLPRRAAQLDRDRAGVA